MQFEDNPTDEHKHALLFEAGEDEVEAIAAAYREDLYIKAMSGNISEIKEYERQFAEWDERKDHTMFTNRPLEEARRLEAFHRRTADSIRKMIETGGLGPAFDTDAIARRIRLGEKALVMAGMIQAEFETERYHRMMDEVGVNLFTEPQSSSNF